MRNIQLKSGTLLQGGKYRIEKALGQGGFGITYLALQTNLNNRRVAIKEFFLKEHCERDSSTSRVSMGTSGSRELVEKFKHKFIKEAETISGFRNHHIITIHDIFEENDTAYYVMEYLSCGSLSDRIPDGGLPAPEALGYIHQVCDALSYIHEDKILHLDIKPSNILFRKFDEAVLIDFGISKHYDEAGGSQTSSTPVGVSRGYAPLEQYKQSGVSKFSPATDIYSLGATLYKLLTGQTPPDADEVNEDGLPPLPSKVSSSVGNAVRTAMSPRRKDRPQSVSEFLAILNMKVVDLSAEETKLSDQESGSLSGNHVSYSEGVLRLGMVEYPMVYVEGGDFVMGGDGGVLSQRRHKVRIDSYSIGRYQVTQELWQAVMGSNPSHFIGSQLPVESVSWNDCQDFIRKLNDLTGESFRLPTEAEWEYAARGGNKSLNYCYAGSDYIEHVAWYNKNSGKMTHNVGGKLSNELGLYDMSGNVFEWCNDWSGLYGKYFQINPKGPRRGSSRVLRGGAWVSVASFSKIFQRYELAPDQRSYHAGFRLCL